VELTRDFRQTVVERAQRDPAFARALLDEAATLLEELEETEVLLALHEAAAEIAWGEGSPASEALPRLRKRLGVREQRG
jgi:hypothetical protein